MVHVIIFFVSQNGGCVKTTLSVNFAALASTYKVPVCLIDLDPQSSASAWSAVRGDGIKVEACHPPLLNRTIESLKNKGYELIIIDTPPHNSTAAANAIRASDFVIIPVRPASFDIAAMNETAELVKNNTKKAGAVINAVPANTHVATAAEDELKASGIEILGHIGHRMSIQHALTEGRGVIESEPKSLASKEFITIWNHIMERI